MPDLPPIREVIGRHNLAASKALGQNFLLDEQLLARIAALPGDLSGAQVLEVGPGPGGLTRALLRAGARVTAIEMDRRCLPALAELGEAFPGQLTVIEGDALKLDHNALMGGQPFHVLSNLPYNVGTALFVRWLGGEAWPPLWQSLTLMFQREVAERIVAKPGSDHYGRLSVAAASVGYAKRMLDVGLKYAMERKAFGEPIANYWLAQSPHPKHWRYGFEFYPQHFAFNHEIPRYFLTRISPYQLTFLTPVDQLRIPVKSNWENLPLEKLGHTYNGLYLYQINSEKAWKQLTSPEMLRVTSGH